MLESQLIDGFGEGDEAAAQRAEMVKAAHWCFDSVERRLDGRAWIACDDFTVADILLVCVLREIRKTDLLAAYPRLSAYYAWALAQSAWQRALAAYTARLGVTSAEHA